ncbi:AraC family transcriptional regulator [Flavobacterium sp. ov086]|jgi:AraC-like DNA-binding protein|uniref:helix-turn-helix domain-containing protein n=1 Tax=Flavobacterium sp. ov086 TaxID=1761785 RepID=UPI000B6B7FAE|nr:AraC family transcriptional regulator [Flavobacterium sp. ov086]SNR76723.1 AraC-type DNA-binding protein [Flavobacterium sp. ov086]
MEIPTESTYRNIDIPAIRQDIGLQHRQPDLLVYDSSHHNSDFIRNKPFRSGHFSVILVIKDSMKIKVNFFEYELTAKEVLIVPPYAIREMLWEGDNVHFISLLFTSEFLTEAGILGKYFNVANFLKEGMVALSKVTQSDHALLLELTKIIHTLLNADSYRINDDEVIRNLFRAALLKVKQYYDEIPVDKKLSASLIYRFIKLLSQHYLSHREVSFYAEKLNINEKYLTQLLKRKTGKTARQFIIEMVILEAKVVLNENILSVKEIASRLHFENQFHFSRFFKQYAGVSPTEYKKL